MPIEQCQVISKYGGCVWLGPKDGPMAYREHPDGLQILSDDVTNADLEFLKSAVTLRCYEYVFRVFIKNEILFVFMGGLERKKGYRGFGFKRNKNGQWELDRGPFVIVP